MNKGLTLIFCMIGLIMLLSPPNVAGYRNWVPLDGGSDKTGASATVISSNERETVIRIKMANQE